MPDLAPIQVIGLSVTRRPVNHRGDWIFVSLTDADSRVGIGEASHSGDDAAVIRLLEGGMGQQVRATLWTDPGGAWRSLGGLGFEQSGRVPSTAASAIEQALWDLAAQRAGVTLASMLGAPSDVPVVPLYANINRATVDRSPAGFAANAAQAVRDGFEAIKLAPFDEVERGSPTSEQRGLAEPGIERVAAVRAAVGRDVRVMVDCHWRFDVANALAMSRALEPLDLGWLEDPVPYEHGPDETVAVRLGAPMPIATGERLIGAAAFTPFLDSGAADYYLPDVKHVGGIGELHSLALASAGRGVQITPHNPSGPVSTLASASVLAGVPHAGPLEFAWGEAPWRPEVLTPPERIEAGALVLPTEGVGLGARLGEA